jgi:hypothetical protein
MPKSPAQHTLYALPQAETFHRFCHYRPGWAKHGPGSIGDQVPLPWNYREISLADQIQKGSQLMPQFFFASGGFFTGLLMPVCLGLRLAAGQADATGQDQHVGGDGVPFPVVRQLHLMEEFREAFVLACLEQLSRRTYKGRICVCPSWCRVVRCHL